MPIENGLKNMSVTAKLIGIEIYNLEFVQCENQQGYIRNSQLFGASIDENGDRAYKTDYQGSNLFAKIHTARQNGIMAPTLRFHLTYHWFHDNGYENFGDWVEGAYRQASAANR